MVRAYIVLLASLFFSGQALGAASERLPTSIDQQTRSVRAQGMGGAFTAVVNDYNALSFNPAALAFLKEYQIHATLISGGVDPELMDFVSDVSDAIDSSTDTTTQTTAVLNVLGKEFWQ